MLNDFYVLWFTSFAGIAWNNDSSEKFLDGVAVWLMLVWITHSGVRLAPSPCETTIHTILQNCVNCINV